MPHITRRLLRASFLVVLVYVGGMSVAGVGAEAPYKNHEQVINAEPRAVSESTVRTPQQHNVVPVVDGRCNRRITHGAGNYFPTEIYEFYRCTMPTISDVVRWQRVEAVKATLREQLGHDINWWAIPPGASIYIEINDSIYLGDNSGLKEGTE